MSARRATTRPGRPPRSTPTTPVWATPVRTSRPSARRCSATFPLVRTSRFESSGCWWKSRRQVTTCCCVSRTAASRAASSSVSAAPTGEASSTVTASPRHHRIGIPPEASRARVPPTRARERRDARLRGVRQPFCIVDVFAEEKWAGNQLAVVLDAGGLDDRSMQRIARETNFSETTFVVGERAGGFEVRIFTPAAEIPFAGHPTLGTAWVLRHERLAEPAERVALQLGIGEVPVRFEQQGDVELGWLDPGAPELGGELDAAPLAEVLGLDAADLHPELPAREVRIGIPFTFVPLRGLDAVRRARFSLERYEASTAAAAPPMFFVFSTETDDPDNQVHARMFAPGAGVPEDPATGSANACLAAYLLEHRVLGEGAVRARVEQGVEMGRPSLLRLRAEQGPSGIRVEVGGRVFLSARGELL